MTGVQTCALPILFVGVELLDKMNWSWESLIFADNMETFAYVKDLATGNILTLETHGEVSVLDIKDNSRELSIDEVMTIALAGDIYDPDKYEISNNNWFSCTYGKMINNKEFELLEDDVFEAMPKDIDSLIDILLDIFEHYFSRN